jgi:SAM-dependent methyltransferase
MEPFTEQAAYWDSVSEEKTFTLPLQRHLFERHVPQNSRILDIGCGYGRTLAELHGAGYRNLVGVDYAPGMLDRGRALHPHLDLRKSQGDALPFDSGAIDVVILIAVLTCIAPTKGQHRLLAEIHRVLGPQGLLYANDYLLNTDERNLERYERWEAEHGTYGIFELPEGAVVRHHTEEHVQDLFRDFDTLAFERVTYTTMNGNASNGFYYLGKKK